MSSMPLCPCPVCRSHRRAIENALVKLIVEDNGDVPEFMIASRAFLAQLGIKVPDGLVGPLFMVSSRNGSVKDL